MACELPKATELTDLSDFMPKLWLETAVTHEPIEDLDLTNAYYFYRIVIRDKTGTVIDVDLRKSRRDYQDARALIQAVADTFENIMDGRSLF